MELCSLLPWMFRVSVTTRPFVLAAGLSGLACGAGSEAREPTPSLSRTRQAQAAFRDLSARFFDEDEARRPLLKPALERFLARYGSDPRSVNVRVLLAWVAVLEGDHARAERFIAEARAASAPSARDFAEVAAARALLARKQPGLALAKLVPLEGKLVDPAERLICSELRLQAALASQRFADALVALTGYLAAAPAEFGDRARVRAAAAVESLPETALEQGLSELDGQARRGALSQPDVWLRRVLRERLIRLAVEHQDARLARRLLDSHPGLAQNSDRAAELLRLAASAGTNAKSQGSFVGLALEVGDADAERRSASIARGLSDALSASLPGADSLPLVVKASDAERVAEVLGELAGSGALALVAGASATSAERAATWAVSGSAPVLLISDTPQLVISELSFVLGTSELDQTDALHKELERRSLARWVRVGSGGFDCRAAPDRAGQSRFPVSDWKRDGIEAAIVLGPRGCVLEVFAETREQRLSPLIAIGLEGAEVLDSFSGRRFALSAGAFPDSKAGADVPADFYEALGRDAGALVRAAWSKLSSTDARESAARRAKLPEALANVTTPLQSTDASGFAGKRRLPRRLTIREGR